MLKVNNTNFYKLYLYCLLLLLFLFSSHRVGSTIPIVILCILFIFDLIRNKKNFLSIISENKFIVLTGIYLLICTLSFFQAENFESFIEKEKLKLLFVVVPILLFNVKDLIRSNFKLIIKTSIYSCLLAIILFTITACVNFSSLGSNAFLYSQLVSVSFINPIVYAILLNINIVLTFFFTDNKYLKAIIILIFSIFIMLLISKIGIIILFLNLSTFIFLILKSNKKQGVFLIMSILMLGIFLGPKFLNNELVKRRINVFKYYTTNNNSENLEKQFPRKVIFNSSLSIVKNNPILGVGISNTKIALSREYEKIGFKKGLKYSYDAHNQYLETLIGLGIIGFISLISLLAYLFYLSLKTKNWALLYLVSILCIVFLVESFLESQMGVMTLLLFSSILIIKDPKH